MMEELQAKLYLLEPSPIPTYSERRRRNRLQRRHLTENRKMFYAKCDIPSEWVHTLCCTIKCSNGLPIYL